MLTQQHHCTDNGGKGRDARTEELTKGYFSKLCDSKGKGQRERKSRGRDFSPMEGLMYMKVVLSNKKEKKKKPLFWPYASLLESSAFVSDKNVYLVEIMKSLLMKYRDS